MGMQYINTLEAYENYIEAGFDPKKAKSMTIEQQNVAHDISISLKDNFVTKESFQATVDSLVTKDYFHQEMNIIRQEFTILKQEFKGLRWVVLGVGALIIVPLIEHYVRLILSALGK